MRLQLLAKSPHLCRMFCNTWNRLPKTPFSSRQCIKALNGGDWKVKVEGSYKCAPALSQAKVTIPWALTAWLCLLDTKTEVKHRRSTYRASGMVLVAARTWRPLHTGTGGVGHGRCSVCLSRSVIPAKPKIKTTEEVQAQLKETISAEWVTLF